MQDRFSKNLLFQSLALVALIAAARIMLNYWPDREALGPRVATMRFTPVDWAAADVAPLRLAGAWQVGGDDPRIGAVSALALDESGFVAVTDSGVVIRFPRPGSGPATALVNELPAGPATPGFKFNRDSEALVADPLARGWWVAFENLNQMWLYDAGFTRALARVDFGAARWRRNQGIEGLAAAPNGILAFPEAGDDIVLWDGRKATNVRLKRPLGQISEAARLPGGGLIVIHRIVSPLGFANAVTLLNPLPGGGFSTARSFPLRGTGGDNFEALAAERLGDGGTRLWLMTDDNFQRPLRTLLIALDVPKDVGG